MSWEVFDITPCIRCGVPGGNACHDGTCDLCKLEIEAGLEWPWLSARRQKLHRELTEALCQLNARTDTQPS